MEEAVASLSALLHDQRTFEIGKKVGERKFENATES